MARRSEVIRQHLFTGDGLNAYAILDGASIPNLLTVLYGTKPPIKFECLFRGDLAPDMAWVAPYLVQLDPKAEFTDWLIDAGWGNHWGIFALSQLDFQSIRYHFRSLTRVYDETGMRFLYFRYYDPRVLCAFLPTCQGPQLDEVFGPVDYYLAEGEPATDLQRFNQESGALVATKAILPKVA
ncbi:MAG: DUF4123 domain-containing protein [Gallionellaceae bacterium]|nr:DUF4123 domain-containing protein [Gallionellaceae bacterium]